MRSTRELLQRTCRRNGEQEAGERRQSPAVGAIYQDWSMSAWPEKTEEAREESRPVVQRTVVSQPIRENSVYRQLMRSHDRVHTRHLQG